MEHIPANLLAGQRVKPSGRSWGKLDNSYRPWRQPSRLDFLKSGCFFLKQIEDKPELEVKSGFRKYELNCCSAVKFMWDSLLKFVKREMLTGFSINEEVF